MKPNKAKQHRLMPLCSAITTTAHLPTLLRKPASRTTVGVLVWRLGTSITTVGPISLSATSARIVCTATTMTAPLAMLRKKPELRSATGLLVQPLATMTETAVSISSFLATSTTTLIIRQYLGPRLWPLPGASFVEFLPCVVREDSRGNTTIFSITTATVLLPM